MVCRVLFLSNKEYEQPNIVVSDEQKLREFVQAANASAYDNSYFYDCQIEIIQSGTDEEGFFLSVKVVQTEPPQSCLDSTEHKVQYPMLRYAQQLDINLQSSVYHIERITLIEWPNGDGVHRVPTICTSPRDLIVALCS